MLLKIAWRNIWRHRKRSLVLMLSVASGLWAGLFLMGFYFGLGEQRVDSAIRNEISHLQLHHPEFRDEQNIRLLIPDGEGIGDRLRTDTAVKALSRRAIVRAMISTASGSAGVQVNGVDPDDEQATSGIAGRIQTGFWFTTDKKNQIVISEKLASKLKLKQGSKAIITFEGPDTNLTAGAFRITGIYSSSNVRFDEVNIYVKRSDLNALSGQPGAVHEIALLLRHNSQLDAEWASMKKRFPTLLTERWMEISPETDLIISTIDQMVYIFMSIILIALAFGIVNTMLMAVLERTREIGMLMALGMTRLRIFGMIVLETAMLVFAGSPFGMLAAWITVEYSGRKGINLAVFSEAFRNLGYSETVFPRLELRHYEVILLLVTLTAILSAIYPARKALALKPADAIRK